MLQQTKRQVKKPFFFPEMHLYFIMFITAVWFLFLLNGDVIYRDDDDNNDEEDDDEDKQVLHKSGNYTETNS